MRGTNKNRAHSPFFYNYVQIIQLFIYKFLEQLKKICIFWFENKGSFRKKIDSLEHEFPQKNCWEPHSPEAFSERESLPGHSQKWNSPVKNKIRLNLIFSNYYHIMSIKIEIFYVHKNNYSIIFIIIEAVPLLLYNIYRCL